MKSTVFDIKQPKTIVKNLPIWGWGLLLLGIILSFVIDSEVIWRSYIIGPFLIIGGLIIFSLKVYLPLVNKGTIRINNSEIKISKQNEVITILVNQLLEVKAEINGGHMTLNKDWSPLSKEFYPYQHGHENELLFKKVDGEEVKTQLYLESDGHEKILRKLLIELASKNDIKLSI